MNTSNPATMTVPEPDREPDEALVAAVRAGQERAASELVMRHGAALARYLYSGGAAREDVEDLVQEAFFRAFRSLHTWRGDATFRSWLFRIAENLRKDAYRKGRGLVIVSILDREVRDWADPAGETEARDAEARLREGIGRLPRLQREVFLLRVQEGMEYEAIARTCGTTSGAARVHYHQAVKRLKEWIG